MKRYDVKITIDRGPAPPNQKNYSRFVHGKANLSPLTLDEAVGLAAREMANKYVTSAEVVERKD